MSVMTAEVSRLVARPNYAHIATLMPDGAPHSVPVWIDLEGDNLVILTGPGSRKARNLERDPRLAISGDHRSDIPQVHGQPLSTAYRPNHLADQTRSCTGRDLRLTITTTN